jgi:glutamate synthase domain-containing protein 2
MTHMMEMCKKSKTVYGDKIIIMAGNIARPETYDLYAKSGIDYIRLGIGSGNVCTTAANTGIHYPLGSLIFQCNERRNAIRHYHLTDPSYLTIPKLIADGGFKNFDQMIKALALGADYVMLGEVLAKSKEACGVEYYIDKTNTRIPAGNGYPATHREYFGMSTEKAQLLVNDASKFSVDGYIPKHSEGQVRYVPIEYSITDWVADFEHALRSSMSYAGTKRLYGEDGYVGNVEYDYMTPVTYNAYMK